MSTPPPAAPDSTPAHASADESAESPDSVSVLAPLRRKRVRRMVGAQFLAETGDGITLVALPLYVYERTGSELLTSITFAAEMGVGAVGAVAGGVLADTFDRQRVLLTSYLVRAALLAAAFAVDPLLAAVSLGVLARAGGQADNPSFDALVPTQARGDLQQLLALRRLIQGVSISVGPAVGAFIVAAVGPRTGIAVNAAAFVVAWVILQSVKQLDTDHASRRVQRSGQTTRDAARRPRTRRPRDPRRTRPHPTRRLPRRHDGHHRRRPRCRHRLVRTRPSKSADTGSGAVAAYGIGTVIGLYLAGRHTFTWPLPRILVASAPVYATATAIGIAAEITWLLPATWLIWGIALGPEMVTGEVFIVRTVPAAGRGRAYASIGVAITIGFAIGYTISGPLLENFTARSVLLGLALAILASGPCGFAPPSATNPTGTAPEPRDSSGSGCTSRSPTGLRPL